MLVTDRTACGDRRLDEIVEAAVEGGVNVVQLREKDLPAGDLYALAVRLRQIVGNYASNALKFTEQGSIDISVVALPGCRVRIDVSDTGPGICDTLRPRLFQPFTQADSSTTREYGGTGLGLSICRQLAELMGGEVGVDSEPGAGSRFWAEVPLPPAGVVVLLSCAKGEVSVETGVFGHGIFTYYLTEGLKGAADLNRDGIVSLQELYEYVEQQVSRKSRLVGGNQHPVMKGEQEGVLPLTKVRAR
jgi:anti-sigma regulatory factor (Ser/Thr protein kinase)